MVYVEQITKSIFCLITTIFMVIRLRNREYSALYCISSIVVIVTTIGVNSLVSYVILCNIVNFISEYTKEEHLVSREVKEVSTKIYKSKEEFYQNNQLLGKGGLVK